MERIETHITYSSVIQLMIDPILKARILIFQVIVSINIPIFVDFFPIMTTIEDLCDQLELKEDDIRIYKELYDRNTIELSIWSLTKLPNYRYARKRLESTNEANESPRSYIPSHFVDLSFDTAHSPHLHRRNRSVQKTVQENEGDAHYRVNFIRMDENDALHKDGVKLSFHCRFIRRNQRVQGWNTSCSGNDEFVVRFHMRSNHLINWIGFAALSDRLMVSTTDTDTCILHSWVKWFKATGLHKYSETYSYEMDHMPHLSPGCEFAVEIECNKPLLTSVIRETFETVPELTQILGDDFIFLHLIVYDLKLQNDSDIWFFLSKHVADICDLDRDEIDEFTAKTAAAATDMKNELRRSSLLSTFGLIQSAMSMRDDQDQTVCAAIDEATSQRLLYYKVGIRATDLIAQPTTDPAVDPRDEHDDDRITENRDGLDTKPTIFEESTSTPTTDIILHSVIIWQTLIVIVLAMITNIFGAHKSHSISSGCVLLVSFIIQATRSDAGYTQTSKLTAADGGINDYFGGAHYPKDVPANRFEVYRSTQPISLFDDYLAIGAYGDNSRATDSGSVYVFNKNNDGTWSQSAKLTAADGGIYDYFGSAVSLFDDYLAIGAYGDNSRAVDSGSVYVFNKNNNGTWSQSVKLTAADGGINDYFGSALSLFDDYLAIGAYGDNSRAVDSGSVYVFNKNNDGTWSQSAKLTAADGGIKDYFGSALSLSDDYLAIGAYGDDSRATNSGSVYMYSTPTKTPTSAPTNTPTSAPTKTPTSAPTASPSFAPTKSPTAAPTESPSARTETPTSAPSLSPSSAPSTSPTSATYPPSATPTSAPTTTPSSAPTETPSSAPSETPTSATSAPTASPSSAPSATPTFVPSAPPSSAPTNTPSYA
eukprot:323782_1